MQKIQMRRVNLEPLILNPNAKLEELMLWRNSDLNNCTLLHAVAYYGDGISLLEVFSNCEQSEINNAILDKLVMAKDSDGNTCVHLASFGNNINFLCSGWKLI